MCTIHVLVTCCFLGVISAGTVVSYSGTTTPCHHIDNPSQAPGENLYHEPAASPVNLIENEMPELASDPPPIPTNSSTVIQAKRTNALTRTINQILANYDRRIRPDFYGPPVEIEVTMMIKGFSAISEVDMEFEVDFYLRQFWKDTRLQFDLQPRVDVIGLSHEFSDKIWHPDTFFPNEKKSYIHSATVLNEFIRLYPNGQILKSTRLTLTATCAMDLQYFPFDQQNCSVEVGSYGNSEEQIRYIWKPSENPVRLGLNSIVLPQFRVLGHREKTRMSHTSTGKYTILCTEFLFVRFLNYYLTQFYIPAALVVVVSWFSLWMGRDAAAERMALGVTTVLTITTLLLSTNSNSPKISYVKAIDVYLGVCFSLVFISLLQSAAIGYLCKKFNTQEMRKNRLEDQRNAMRASSMRLGIQEKRSPDGMFIVEDNTNEEGKVDEMVEVPSRSPTIIDMEYEAVQGKLIKSKARIARYDVISRIAFPAGFALFNVVYWSYYLYKSKGQDDESSWNSH